MTIANQNILSLIPQKPPFVMVDRLLFSDENITQTIFRVSRDNVLVSGDEFTEAGLMENIAQTAAAGTGYKAILNNKSVVLGYIGSVKNFEVFGLPRVNDELLTEVKIEDQLAGITIISGTVKCKDVLMARCEMNVYISKP